MASTLSAHEKAKLKKQTLQIQALDDLKLTAPSRGNRIKIENIKQLFLNKLIPNYKTAFNACKALNSTHKSVIKSGKPEHMYKEIVNKYASKKEKFDATVILYIEPLKDGNGNVVREKGYKYKDDLKQVHHGFHELNMQRLPIKTFLNIKRAYGSIEAF